MKLRAFWREWRGWILFIALMLMFRSAIADWHQVPTRSMVPAILDGDRIVVDKIAYDLRIPFTFIRLARWDNPERSEVVTFESPKDGTLLVKRVIGVPGDVISMENNVLTVNGEQAQYTRLPSPEEPQVEVLQERVGKSERQIRVFKQRPRFARASFDPVTIPPDHYLMMGDNRDISLDSRFWGLVHRDLITGKANAVAFSVDYDNYYAPRADRFLEPITH